VDCFDPKPLPPDPPLEIDDELLAALSSADRALARLDGATSTLPDPELFVYAFMRQEAVFSSQIEGTQASLDDLLEFEADQSLPGKSDDVADVVNYLGAMRWGREQLPTLPVSLRLIRGIHRRLLASGRGSEKSPGEFRRYQNWIGPAGCSIGEAIFVPPAIPLMTQALSDWESFLHSARKTPPLIKCALAHAQFETIHPFSDGNGRLGRMIVTLLLCAEGILAQPVLYLSLFFKQYRDEYYARLQATRDAGDWESWLLFFLKGVIATSRAALRSAHRINRLREGMLANVSRNVRSNNGTPLIGVLFRKPYVSNTIVATALGVSFPTAAKLVQEFRDLGYLTNIGGAQRGKWYAFKPYLDILHESVDDLTGVIDGEDLLVSTQ